jgi:hypothetical protein
MKKNCFLCLFVSMLAAVMGGCKVNERVVTVVEARTDTLIITKHERDSIHVHDSTYIHDRGDTVLVERWRTSWRDRTVHDTVYKSRTDSVPVPYPVRVEVPAELTWWQRTKMGAGIAFMALILIHVIIMVVKLKK